MRYPAEGSPLTHFHTHSHTAHSARPLRIHCTRSLLLTPRTAFNTHQQMHSLMKDLVSAITHSRLLIDILFCTNSHREWMKISLRCSFIISSRASVVPPEIFSRTDTESSIQKANKNESENTKKQKYILILQNQTQSLLLCAEHSQLCPKKGRIWDLTSSSFLSAALTVESFQPQTKKHAKMHKHGKNTACVHRERATGEK